MNALLEREIAHRAATGWTPVSVASMGAAFRALGYALDRRMDCRGIARVSDGRSYPVVTTGVRHIATGLSAFNVDAPRGEAFRAMQALRQEAFAISRGAILEA
jgi:hypothetical protein